MVLYDEKIVEKLIEIIPELDFIDFPFGRLTPEHKFEEALNEQFPDLKWDDYDLLEAFDRLIKDGVIDKYMCYVFND